MGLFSTSLHVYKKSQLEVLNGTTELLRKKYELNNFERIPFTNANFKETIEYTIGSKTGVYYLITEQNGNWTTIVELNIKIEKPFYLYDITNGLSKILSTYVLMLHIHDSDISLYNLEHNGNSLDGYNSDPTYFSSNASRDEILLERHQPAAFSNILPEGKDVESLNAILNDGFWTAFDNNDFDDNGIPENEIYFEEEARLIDVGKYLEIYEKEDFPFIDWYDGIQKLNLSKCYLLRAYKSSLTGILANLFWKK